MNQNTVEQTQFITWHKSHSNSSVGKKAALVNINRRAAKQMGGKTLLLTLTPQPERAKGLHVQLEIQWEPKIHTLSDSLSLHH